MPRKCKHLFTSSATTIIYKVCVKIIIIYSLWIFAIVNIIIIYDSYVARFIMIIIILYILNRSDDVIFFHGIPIRYQTKRNSAIAYYTTIILCNCNLQKLRLVRTIRQLVQNGAILNGLRFTKSFCNTYWRVTLLRAQSHQYTIFISIN